MKTSQGVPVTKTGVFFNMIQFAAKKEAEK
jgi:hypothetical protein